MSRERPKALDNLVFGLALLLFCVVAYYGIQQIRQRRAAQRAQAAAPTVLPLSPTQSGASDGLPELQHSGARSFASGVPAVATDVQRR